MPIPDTRPVLYIDVDGVLFGLYGDPEVFQLRPQVNGFLAWCVTNFRCRWLTAWDNKRIESVLGECYSNAVHAITHTKWTKTKCDAIDFAEPNLWYWIEDGISAEETVILQDLGVLDRFIFVSPCGEHELETLQQKLAARLKANGITPQPANLLISEKLMVGYYADEPRDFSEYQRKCVSECAALPGIEAWTRLRPGKEPEVFFKATTFDSGRDANLYALLSFVALDWQLVSIDSWAEIVPAEAIPFEG